MSEDMLSENQRRDLDSLKNRFHLSEEAVNLIRDDWIYGLSSEQTKEYLKPGMKLWQMRIISKCLRAGYDTALIELVGKRGSSEEVLKMVLTLYEKGVPVADIEEQLEETKNAAVLMQIFSNFKEKIDMDELKMRERQDSEPNDNTKTETNQNTDFYKDELSAIKQEIANLTKINGEKDELLKQIEAKDAEIAALKKDKEELDGLLNEAQTSRMMEKSEREKCEVALSAKRNEVEELKKRVADLEKRLDDKNHLENTNGKEAKTGKSTQVTTSMATDVEASYETRKTETFPIIYQAMVADSSGRIIGTMPLEHMKKQSSGVSGIASVLGFKKKSRRDIVKMLTDGKLSTDQLTQIKVAISKGLNEEQLSQVIHSGAPAEQMREIIEIAESLNALGYA